MQVQCAGRQPGQLEANQVLNHLQPATGVKTPSNRAPERWERVPSQFEILAATFG